MTNQMHQLKAPIADERDLIQAAESGQMNTADNDVMKSR
jgi:hypothetical protein